MTIKQNDLPGLSHTKAEVLAYLLQPRNREFVVVAKYNEVTNGEIRLSEYDLLKRIYTAKIRVLIDAGAQILEMNNLQLVKAWLEIDTEAPVAVYFDDSNNACVYYRQGKTLPLLASTFADDLSECLVYLDEAHTRGTDLKLPVYAIGALTRGLGQTKDHTVQGKFAHKSCFVKCSRSNYLTFCSGYETTTAWHYTVCQILCSSRGVPEHS